jgi:glutathione S-transferase
MSVKQAVQPIRLYRHPLSGHAHRVELFLSLLGLPVELVEVDLKNRAQKKPEFILKNPFGQIPVIEDGDVILSDSNAILVYLALKYGDESWLPRDPEGAAAVQRFLSIAAGELAQGPAAARRVNVFGVPLDQDAARAVATRLFTILEQHLASCHFLVGTRPTIADVAGYSYIAHAPEGGISLAEYPNIRSWLDRIRALPGFVPMLATKVAAVA